MVVKEVSSLAVGQGVYEMWWLLMLQAVLAVFFGIIAIFWPGLTLLTLVYLFSAYVLAWGLMDIVHGLMSVGRRGTWWLTLLFGLIGLAVGIYLVRHPAASLATLILLIGLTFIARGVLDIVGTFLDKATPPYRILMLLAGLAAIIAGIVILLQPLAGGVAFVWILGLYALVFGTLMFVMALEARAALLDVLA